MPTDTSIAASRLRVVAKPGEGDVEVRSAEGKLLYHISSPTERALLSLQAAEVWGAEGVEFRFGPL